MIGDEPAIRFEVTLSEATSIWETPPGAGKKGDVEYTPVNLQTGPNPSDVQNPGAWTESVMRKNRVRGNLICGHTKDNPARKAGDGLACRLTSSTFPAANHISDAK